MVPMTRRAARSGFVHMIVGSGGLIEPPHKLNVRDFPILVACELAKMRRHLARGGPGPGAPARTLGNNGIPVYHLHVQTGGAPDQNV